MTMEMWWLGCYMGRLRFALLLLLLLRLLVGLSYHAGFEEAFSWQHDRLSAGVAYAVGFAGGAVGLTLQGVITSDMSVDEVLGKIMLQAVPGSFGVFLARSQLEGRKAQEKERGSGGLFFTRDLRQYSLQLRAKGYAKP
jgi:uncharacterized membrane protein